MNCSAAIAFGCWSMIGLVVVAGLAVDRCLAEDATRGSLNDVVVEAELKTVKLYGAGGSGLDSYQSGFFISEKGHILTVWSTVLDVKDIIVVTSSGGRYTSQVVGIDPNLELAVLKADSEPLNYFDLTDVGDAEVGQRVLALSNLFGIATGREMSSVQKGVIMAKTTLSARRGTFESVYQGSILIIDAITNNPGAAGGALVATDGRLLGMLGKELRDNRVNIWLNYAIPIDQLTDSVERILEGKSIDRSAGDRDLADQPTELEMLGIAMVPNVLAKTPAYIDLIEPGSAAAEGGLKADDLILFINSVRVSSQKSFRDELQYIDRRDDITLLIQRGRQLQEIVLKP